MSVPAPSSARPWWRRIAPGGWTEAGLLAALVFIVVLAFFSPRWVVWHAWWAAPEAFYGPELGRARSALWQVEHLGEPIPDPIHRIIRWRLLLPGAARLLHLPPAAHLALYPLGALACLTFFARFLRRQGVSREMTLFALFALGANAWLFADGWVAFGLVVVAFSRPLWPAFAVCLLIPWSDDRFVLALPLALACRWLVAPEQEARPARVYLGEALLLLGAAGIFVICRLGFEAGGGSASMENYMFPPVRGHVPVFIWGAWECWRAAWLLPLIALVGCREPFRGARWALAAAALALFSSTFFTAFDLSRAGVALIPLACGGLWLLTKTEVGRRWVAGVVVLNAVLPASHIIADIQTPIQPLRYELLLLRDPPQPYAAEPYALAAVKRARARRWDEAEAMLSVARRLKPDAPEVTQAEAVLRLEKGEGETAIGILRERLAAHPDDLDSAALLAEVLKELGRKEESRELTLRVLATLPPKHDQRGRLEALLR